jgi:hypothetical protein
VIDEDPTGFLDQYEALLDVGASLLREKALMRQSLSIITSHAASTKRRAATYRQPNR